MQYTTEMRIIRVMCSGRVDMTHVLKAFSNGIDGVFIGACHLNECNYITHGNYHALNMVLLVKRIMEYIGLNPERLRIQFMSGAEANVFVDSTNDFVKTIKGIGPIGKAEGIEWAKLKAKLDEISRLIPYIKVMKNEKLGTRLLNKDEYDKFFTKDEVEKLFTEKPSYYIDPEKCQACMTCARRCPVEAIESAKQQVHVIDQDKCIRCGSCFEACPPKFRAISKLEAGKPVPPPLPADKRAIVKKAKEEKAS